MCLVPWWDNVFCSHDWESIVLKSAIHETKIRTTNCREKQGCKGYFGFHSRVGYMRETYLLSTPLSWADVKQAIVQISVTKQE